MAKPKVTAIVLAGGKGSRMHSETPKQYLPLLGKPVLFIHYQLLRRVKLMKLFWLLHPVKKTIVKERLLTNTESKKSQR